MSKEVRLQTETRRKLYWAVVFISIGLVVASAITIWRECATLALLGWMGAVILLFLSPWMLVPIAFARSLRVSEGVVEASTVLGPRRMTVVDVERISAWSVPSMGNTQVLFCLRARGTRLGVLSETPFVTVPQALAQVVQEHAASTESILATDARTQFYLGEQTTMSLRVRMIIGTTLLCGSVLICLLLISKLFLNLPG